MPFRRLQSWFRVLDLDTTVVCGMLAKAWVLVSGPVTVLLLIKCFDLELQGYHYTFASMLMFKEALILGMPTLTIQFASHEWAHLKLTEDGAVGGEERAASRLNAIGRFAFRWCFVMGLVFMVVSCVGGLWFLSLQPAENIDWQRPWIASCVCSGIQLMLIPSWALLQGSNQVGSVFQFQLLDNILSRFAMWIAIACGGGLWATAVLHCSTVLTATIFLYARHRRFFYGFATRVGSEIVNWREELLPMQWRLTATSICGCFMLPLAGIVAFKMHGAELAGQLGLTITLLSTVGAMSGLWTRAKEPLFGIFVAQCRYVDLDILLRTLMWRVGCFLVVALGSFVGVVGGLHLIGSGYASRFLAPGATTLFAVGTLLHQLCDPLVLYVRAHKEEPYLSLAFAGTAVMVLGCVSLGKSFQAVGMGASYMTSSAVFLGGCLFIQHRYRQRGNSLVSARKT